jgi:protein-tyrosine-phosphatase
MREILMVCYGNICRSPMAEVLLQAALDRVLGPGHRFVVTSAGTHAFDGGPASSPGVAAMAARGLDLSRHRSRPVTKALIRRADRVVCMTAGHRASVLDLVPEAADKTQTLGDDVPDPLGGSLEYYEAVAALIEARVEALAAQIAAEGTTT